MNDTTRAAAIADLSNPVGRFVGNLILVVMVAGCGQRVPDGMVAVSGRAVFEGKPVSEGTVLFAAVGLAGSDSTPTDSRGRFRLFLRPGGYAVVVRWTDGVDHLDGTGLFVPAKSLIPKRYADAKTSDLRLTVEKGMGPVEFVLQP